VEISWNSEIIKNQWGAGQSRAEKRKNTIHSE